MNKLSIFNYDSYKVRTIEENGKILFCGADVARILGYAKPQNAISKHCKGALKRGTLTTRGKQEMTFISEGDLYRLIAHSKLPTAEKFEHWVFDEVLPTIRKTGGYVSNDDAFISTYLPFADDQTKMLFKSTLQTVRQLNDKIEADRPKVLFADAVTASKTDILIGELAKIIRQNGYEIGEKRLFKWLREHGYLINRKGTDYNAPTQRSVDMGLFRVKETAITHSDGHTTISKTTKVTGKGQSYFINKFLAQ